MSHRFEPLADQELGRFSCGVDELDDWLRRHARHSAARGTRTYVLVDETGDVTAYAAIAPQYVDRATLPSRFARGAPERVPSILIAKLAVDRRVQGRGVGTELLMCVATRVLIAARMIGGKLLVVDAIDEDAAGFYVHHGFVASPEVPDRLVLPFRAVAAMIGHPGP